MENADTRGDDLCLGNCVDCHCHDDEDPCGGCNAKGCDICDEGDQYFGE